MLGVLPNPMCRVRIDSLTSFRCDGVIIEFYEQVGRKLAYNKWMLRLFHRLEALHSNISTPLCTWLYMVVRDITAVENFAGLINEIVE